MISFLALPLETRHQIYRLCIPHNTHFILKGRTCRPAGEDPPEDNRIERSRRDFYDEDFYDEEIIRTQLPIKESPPAGEHHWSRISLVCRQISNEIRVLLYGDNFFQVDACPSAAAQIVNMFPTRCRDKMRKMVLVLRRTESVDQTEFNRDQEEFWAKLLGQISTLHLVVEDLGPSKLVKFLTRRHWSFNFLLNMQPFSFLHLEPPAPTGPVTIRDYEEWKTALTSRLKYLNQSVSATTTIVVKSEKMESIVELVEKTLPSRCAFEELEDGHGYFKEQVHGLFFIDHRVPQ